MRFLNVKTNALRRFPDNSYTLNSKANKNALCDACALYDTCRNSSESVEIKSCSKFKPIFIFRDGKNLDSPLYNTIRTGKAWFKRLVVGQVIAVFDKETKQLSNATVKSIHWSEDKSEILSAHSKFNHLGMSLENPEKQLESILQSSYGKGFYSKSKGLTAIYLEPIAQALP